MRDFQPLTFFINRVCCDCKETIFASFNLLNATTLRFLTTQQLLSNNKFAYHVVPFFDE